MTYNLTIDTYGGTADNPELEEKAELLKEKILRDTQELTEILQVDLPKFLERQTKAMFLDEYEFSDKLSTEQVKAIKDDVAATGKIALDEIIPRLQEDVIWLDAKPKKTSTLADNEAVWGLIQKICDYQGEIMSRHDFPRLDLEQLKGSYRLPTWFVSGRLCKSIVESYWRNLEDYQTLQEAIHARGANERKKNLMKKWDEAS